MNVELGAQHSKQYTMPNMMQGQSVEYINNNNKLYYNSNHSLDNYDLININDNNIKTYQPSYKEVVLSQSKSSKILSHQFKNNEENTIEIPDKRENIQSQTISFKRPNKTNNQIVEKKKSEKEQSYLSPSIIFKANYLSSININNPIKMRILIDTGAEEVNLLSNNSFKKWKELDKNLKLSNNTFIIQPIGNNPLSNLGAVQLPLQFKNEPKQLVNFVVVENLNGYDAILGVPAIQQLNIKLDFNLGEAIIADQTLKLNINDYIKKSEIRIKEDTIISPGTERIIEIEVDKTIFNNDEESYHTIIPSKALVEAKILKLPSADKDQFILYINI